MNDPQIDILARVYVKDVYGGDTDFIDEAEQVLTWLSQRYCIVEKEALSKWIDPKDKLPEIRERVLICENVASLYKIFIGKRVPSPCTDGWEWNQSKKENVAAWMPLPKYSPSIAKEMKE